MGACVRINLFVIWRVGVIEQKDETDSFPVLLCERENKKVVA